MAVLPIACRAGIAVNRQGRGLWDIMAKELAKNVAVVRADELDRIKRSISGKAETELEGERRIGERQGLYQKSQKRKENWGNTIEAIRKKKENERLRRFEEQEMERRKIDAEEAAIQGR